MNVLSCRGLRKVFRGNVVLHGLDLDVAEHEVVVLIGASGSGKSTLLRCVNLLETGRRRHHPPRRRAHHRPVGRTLTGSGSRIGMVFQAFNLFPHLTVLDNVTLAPRRVHGGPAAMPRPTRCGCWNGSAWPARHANTPTGSQVASSSGSRSSARWSASPAACCSTRSPRRLTPNWSARCSA